MCLKIAPMCLKNCPNVPQNCPNVPHSSFAHLHRCRRPVLKVETLMLCVKVKLKVTTNDWSDMRQATEIKQETRQTNSSVTVMLHDRKGELTGLEPFCGIENVQAASLPLSKSSLAEAHLALCASCVVSDVLTAAMHADAPRFQVDKKQHQYLIASRPRDGVTSRMITQPRTPRGLVSHTLKNVAARSSVAFGPETSCCGTAASYLN